MARQLTDTQKAAAKAARASRRTFAGTADADLLLALTLLQHRERTAIELADLAGRPAAVVAGELRAAGLELPDRTDHGHDGITRTVYNLSPPDARAVAAWVRRRDRDARKPAPDAQASLFGDADAPGAPASPRSPAKPPTPPDRRPRLLLHRLARSAPSSPTTTADSWRDHLAPQS